MVATLQGFKVAMQELSRPAQVDELAPDQRQVLFERTLRVECRLSPLGNSIYLVSILLTGTMVIPSATGWFRPAWTIASAALAVGSIMTWLPRSLDRHHPGRGVLWGLRAEMALWSVGNGALLWRAMPPADGDHRVLLVATFVGVLGGGTLALSTERSISFTWLWGQVLTGSAAVLASGTPHERLLCALFVLYGTCLTLLVLHLSATFERRCLAELAADAERAVVRLLLDDVEGGTRDWLWQMAPDGGLTEVTSRFAMAAGQTVEQVQGVALVALLEGLRARELDGGPEALAGLDAALGAHQPFRDLEVPVSVHGADAWWSLTGHPSPTAEGIGWRGVGADVTEDHRHRAEVLRLATVDPLTELANRHQFNHWLAERVEARAEGSEVVLGIIDLDNFKVVNDTLGHPIGDRLLAAVADRLRATSQAGDGEGVARLGGDEFAVLLPLGPPAGDPRPRLEAYVADLRRPFSIDGTRIEIHGSMGWASLPADTDDIDDLVRFADLALYRAKDAGRDAVHHFDRGLAVAADQRALALHDLGQAVDRDEFVLWFQPLLDLASGEVAAFEALLRWQHPQRGTVGPDAFIQVAEETGLIVPIGRAVVRRALAEAAHWPAEVRIAVNISPTQLAASGFADGFGSDLVRSGLDPARVEVEVTESGVVDRDAQRVLAQVRSAGVGVAIDDFGTGYSSFARLGHLPIDTVKIDRAFVNGLHPMPGHPSQVLVRAIVEMADALGLSTVAEGVETTEQAEILRSLGCRTVQGYLYAKPMPADDVLPYLEQQRQVR